MNITENTDYIKNIDNLAIVKVGSAISSMAPDHVIAVTEDIVDKDFMINNQNGLRQNVINQYLNERIDEAIAGGAVLDDYAKKTELQKYVATSALTNTLKSYVATSALTNTLNSYVGDTELTNTLKNYVTSTALTNTLNSYVGDTELENTLKSYVATTALTDTLNRYVTEDELANKKYISGNIRDVALGEESSTNIVNKMNTLCESGEYLFKEDKIQSNSNLPMVSINDVIDAKIIVLSNYNSTNSGTTGMIFNITQIMHLSNRTQKNSGIYTRTFSGLRTDIATKWGAWTQTSMNKINSFDDIKMKGIYQGQIEDEDCVIIDVKDVQYKFSPIGIEYRATSFSGETSGVTFGEWEEYGGSSLNAIVDGETLIFG